MKKKLIVVGASLFVLALVISVFVLAFNSRQEIGGSLQPPVTLNPENALLGNSPIDVTGETGVFPELLVLTNDFMGGIGSLPWNEKTRQYDADAFESHVYVYDEKQKMIRAMRPDENSGNIATITAAEKIGDVVYAFVPEKNTLLVLDGHFYIVKQVTYQPKGYGGGSKGRQFWVTADKKAFVIRQGLEFIAFDTDLQELSRLMLSQAGPYIEQFSREGEQLYFSEGIDTGPYTDCIGGPCGRKYSVSGTIDFSDPHHLTLRDFVEKDDDHPAVYAPFKAYDSASKQWLVVNRSFNNSDRIEVRPASDIARVTDSLTLGDGQHLLSLTETAPFEAVIQEKNFGGMKTSLVSLAFEKGKLSWGKEINLGLGFSSQSIVMHRVGQDLFVFENTSGGNFLQVFNQERNEILKNAFVTSNGENTINPSDFSVAPHFVLLSTTVDRALFTVLLRTDYLNRGNEVRLKHQIALLTPADTWAFPLILEALKNGQQSQKVLLIQSLGQLGSGALDAVPFILDLTLAGNSINGNVEDVLFEVLPKIDPSAEKIISELLAFEARHPDFSRATRQVTRSILEKYDTPAARAALKKYQTVNFWSWFAPTARAAEVSPVVTSSDFRLQGPDGKVTAELTTSLEGTPSLFMYDKKGRVRLNVALYPDGAPGIILNDESGRASALLRMATSQGQPVLIFKENGEDKIVIGLHPLNMFSSTGVSLGNSSFSSGFAMMGMIVISFVAGGFGGAFVYQRVQRRNSSISLPEEV